MSIKQYLCSLFTGIKSLLIGLGTTLKVFFRKKTTEQYPENRATLKMFDRFRGELYMPLKEDGSSKCIGCRICENACPNGTIHIITKDHLNEETGKTKKILDEYFYDLGSCTFCQLCVTSCPYDAIEFNQEYETAVFTRSKLVLKLNPSTNPTNN